MNWLAISMAEGMGTTSNRVGRKERGSALATLLRSRALALLRSGACTVGLLCLFVNLAERDAVLAGEAGAVFVLGSEDGRADFEPAELALHRATRRCYCAGAAVQLVPLHGIPADAEGHGFPAE